MLKLYVTLKKNRLKVFLNVIPLNFKQQVQFLIWKKYNEHTLDYLKYLETQKNKMFVDLQFGGEVIFFFQISAWTHCFKISKYFTQKGIWRLKKNIHWTYFVKICLMMTPNSCIMYNDKRSNTGISLVMPAFQIFQVWKRGYFGFNLGRRCQKALYLSALVLVSMFLPNMHEGK